MKMGTLESMKVLEPYHFVIAELVSSLEKLDVTSEVRLQQLLKK